MLLRMVNTHHVLHNLPSAIAREIIVEVHAEIVLIALFLLFPPLHKQLEASSREDPDMILELGGGLIIHALRAAACFSVFVVFVVCVAIYFQGTVFGRRAYTDVFDFGAWSRLRDRGRFIVFVFDRPGGGTFGSLIAHGRVACLWAF